MICQRCLFRAARPSKPPAAPPFRAFNTSHPRYQAAISAQSNTSAPRQGSPSSSQNPPAATSTSAAQPFSTPLTPSPTNQEKGASDVFSEAAHGARRHTNKPSVPTVLSSFPEGAPLKGLNYFKNKQDPVALADSEYPSWLWTVLDSPKTTVGENGGEEGDLFAKSKKQRRIAAKRMRKQALAHPELFEKRVPIYEQSVDLSADPIEGEEERQELTRAMRGKRRAGIKETNFLKSMS